MTPAEQERLAEMRKLGGEPHHLEPLFVGHIRFLVDLVDRLDARRLELVEEVMKLQADLSTANTTIATQRAAVEQFHRDADGHNFCWVNALRLFVAFGLVAKPLKLPPLDERMHGCAKFWEELERDTGRWPDFPGFAEEVP